jgi:6-phosphofructokinase 2
LNDRKADSQVFSSGGLNEGLPTDFYKKIAEIAKKSNSKLIVDTSGEALKKY